MWRPIRQFLAVTIPTALLLLNAAVVLCFWNLWDEWVAVTVIPIWAWSGAGVLISVLAWPILKSRLALLSLASWLITGLALADETPGLLRQFRSAVVGGGPSLMATPHPPTSPGIRPRLRVATLHCGGEAIAAVAKLESLRPDLVLLQEVPETEDLTDLSTRLYGNDGGMVRTARCAIIGRGRLSISHDDTPTGSLVATYEPAGSQEVVDVMNLNLPRTQTRQDLWRPDSWSDLTARRKANRRLLRGLLEMLPERIGTEHRFVGGNFGTPPTDDLFRLLRNEGLTDGHAVAGHGWGNTYPATIPVQRLDQIWASGRFRPIRSETFSPDSLAAHFLVVTDYEKLVETASLAAAQP